MRIQSKGFLYELSKDLTDNKRRFATQLKERSSTVMNVHSEPLRHFLTKKMSEMFKRFRTDNEKGGVWRWGWEKSEVLVVNVF